MRKFIFFLLIPSISCGVPCDIPSMLNSISPGAQWNYRGGDYATIEWLDKVQAQPTLAQVNQAITTCQSNQVQLQAYAVELSTTQAAVAGLADNYVAASVLQQIQINKNMARIIKLRQLLGLQ